MQSLLSPPKKKAPLDPADSGAFFRARARVQQVRACLNFSRSLSAACGAAFARREKNKWRLLSGAQSFCLQTPPPSLLISVSSSAPAVSVQVWTQTDTHARDVSPDDWVCAQVKVKIQAWLHFPAT